MPTGLHMAPDYKSMIDVVKLAMLQTLSHNRNKHLFTLNTAP